MLRVWAAADAPAEAPRGLDRVGSPTTLRAPPTRLLPLAVLVLVLLLRVLVLFRVLVLVLVRLWVSLVLFATGTAGG